MALRHLRNRKNVKSTTAIRERVEKVIVEEINVTNLIAQREPENYIPKFIQTLTERITEIIQDELRYGR